MSKLIEVGAKVLVALRDGTIKVWRGPLREWGEYGVTVGEGDQEMFIPWANVAYIRPPDTSD